ncbi:MAG: hypothetical protein QOD74_1275, partial [Variibacter sp.]|nr:hypothetical protein [Variibacter sp.]
MDARHKAGHDGVSGGQIGWPEWLSGWLLLLPALLLLLALTIYPVFYGAYLSFFNKHSFFPQQTFVGIDNYLYVL